MKQQVCCSKELTFSFNKSTKWKCFKNDEKNVGYGKLKCPISQIEEDLNFIRNP